MASLFAQDPYARALDEVEQRVSDADRALTAAQEPPKTPQQVFEGIASSTGVPPNVIWALEDAVKPDGDIDPDRATRAAQQLAKAAETSGDMKAALSRGANERAMTAMGVRPGSGRFNEANRRGAMSEGLAAAGAANNERQRVEREGYGRSANAVNLGSGLAVNPGTSAGLASGTANAGFDAAQRGYAQQGRLLNQDYQNRSSAWVAGQQASADLWSGLGSLAGVGLYAAMSDEETKQNKRPARGALRAVEGMRVDEWDYKPGHGDEGRHIGTYAQDFQRETGKGDGHSIPIIDAIGVTMGAVKELSGKVDDLAEGRGAFREVPK